MAREEVFEITPYEFFRKYCGLDQIVSSGSLENDLAYYYNLNYTLKQYMKMTNIVDNFLNAFWKSLNRKTGETEQKINGVKLINSPSGNYSNVLKIDFKRAFSNYAVQIMPKREYGVFENFSYKIAKLPIPRTAKKFLYNYILTNIFMTGSGSSNLNNLRHLVYDDVINLSSSLGTIIKSEVDGCYVQYNPKYFNSGSISFETFGNITLQKFKNVFLLDRVMVLVKEDGSARIKGLEKLYPNIFKKTLLELVSKRNDSVLDNFLYSDKINILEWCYKSKDGNTVKLHISNSTVELDMREKSDTLGLSDFSSKLNREHYYSKIQPTINTFFQLL